MDARVDAAATDHHHALLELETRRNYDERIRRLENDIQMLLGSLHDNRDQQQDHIRQMEDLERDVDELKEKLRELLKQFSEYTQWKLGGTNEILIYSRLLDFEQDRLGSIKQQVHQLLINQID